MHTNSVLLNWLNWKKLKYASRRRALHGLQGPCMACSGMKGKWPYISSYSHARFPWNFARLQQAQHKIPKLILCHFLHKMIKI